MKVKLLKIKEKDLDIFQNRIVIPAKPKYNGYDGGNPSDKIESTVYDVELFREINYNTNVTKDTYIATSKDVRELIDKLYVREVKTALREITLDLKNVKLRNEILESEAAKLTKDNYNLICRIDAANRQRFFERLVWLFKGGSI